MSVVSEEANDLGLKKCCSRGELGLVDCTVLWTLSILSTSLTAAPRILTIESAAESKSRYRSPTIVRKSATLAAAASLYQAHTGGVSHGEGWISLVVARVWGWLT